MLVNKQVDLAQSREVVTIVEVLSPSNKVEGSKGRASYSAKRVEFMNSPCNLVEINLLRTGKSFLPFAASKVDYSRMFPAR